MIEVSLIDGRYHGVGDWPPSPFRVFQALVAGAYGGRWRSESDDTKDAAFRWLEGLAPPPIAAPRKIDSRATTYFVPNNDMDAVDGDPRRVSEIRSGKLVRSILLTGDAPLLYAWPFDHGEEHARRLCGFAERLHTLGRGIDAAFARAQVCDWNEAERRLADYPGAVSRPGRAGDPERDPSCPIPGSLDSLKRRHEDGVKRFALRREARVSVTLFTQPRKAIARVVTYSRAAARLLFDLRSSDDTLAFRPIPQEQALKVAAAVRDLAAWRLTVIWPQRAAEIDRLVVGRGAGISDITRRVRIVPLPSIGHVHTSPSIRRVLLEIPPDCPLSRNDLAAALDNQSLDKVDMVTGEVVENPVTKNTILVPTDGDDMLWHYGIGQASRRWQTVTPAALPEPRRRGRISGEERAASDQRVAAAVAAALRHAGLEWRGIEIRVQREPLRRTGARADAFHADRFVGKLRHVEIVFPEPVSGLLMVGDGRYLGLGLMAPQRDTRPDVAVFAVPTEAGITVAEGPALAHAARRALMSLARSAKGEVPPLFSGHEDNGGRAASGQHRHIFIAADDNDGDGRIDRLIVATPWACDHSLKPDRNEHRRFEAVVSKLDTLRAGRLGVIALGRPIGLSSGDALAGPAYLWESRTLYQTTRHAGRRKDVAAALIHDVSAECSRRGLPMPIEVEILDYASVPNGGGVKARARLRFAIAIEGPLLLGRDSHRGGGLFHARA
jgi:CRISPR-associated protein Csb2